MSVHPKYPDYIVATANLGSITEASAALEVSPTTISAAIKGFEKHYGYRVSVATAGVKISYIGRFEVVGARTDVSAQPSRRLRLRGRRLGKPAQKPG